MATLPAKGAMPEDHPLCLGLGGYPRAVYSTGQSRKFAEEADLCSLWVAVSPARDFELVAQAGERQTRPGRYRSRGAAQKLPADLVILSDIQLFLRALLQQGKEKLGAYGARAWPRMSPRDQRAETKMAGIVESAPDLRRDSHESLSRLLGYHASTRSQEDDSSARRRSDARLCLASLRGS